MGWEQNYRDISSACPPSRSTEEMAVDGPRTGFGCVVVVYLISFKGLPVDSLTVRESRLFTIQLSCDIRKVQLRHEAIGYACSPDS